MKKLIDLPDETFKDLKAIGKAHQRSLKNYIEFVLIEHAKKTKPKK